MWVKCRPESLGLGWCSMERTKRLSAIDRQERAGPDKGGEVYHELSSTEERHPPPSRSPAPPLVQPTVEAASGKNGCN